MKNFFLKKYLLELVVAIVIVLIAVVATYAQTPRAGTVTQMDPWVTSCATRVGQTGTPRVQILTPNGGQVYQTGDQVTVTYRICNVSSNELLMVHIGPNTEQVVADFTTTVGASTGSALITIPNYTDLHPNFSYGKNFRAFVTTGGALDQSDDTFSINSNGPSSQGKVELTARGDYTAWYEMSANGTDGVLPFVNLASGSTTLPKTFTATEIWMDNTYPFAVDINSLSIKFYGQADRSTLPITMKNIRVYSIKGSGNPVLLGSSNDPLNLNFNTTTRNYSGSVLVNINRNIPANEHDWLVIKADLVYATGAHSPANATIRVQVTPNIQMTGGTHVITPAPTSVVGPQMRFDNN